MQHLHSDAIETCELQPGEEDKQFNYYPLAETTISLKVNGDYHSCLSPPPFIYPIETILQKPTRDDKLNIHP